MVPLRERFTMDISHIFEQPDIMYWLTPVVFGLFFLALIGIGITVKFPDGKVGIIIVGVSLAMLPVWGLIGTSSMKYSAAQAQFSAQKVLSAYGIEATPSRAHAIIEGSMQEYSPNVVYAEVDGEKYRYVLRVKDNVLTVHRALRAEWTTTEPIEVKPESIG